MTTKEAIYEKVEQLDEERAKLILEYIDGLLDRPSNASPHFETGVVQLRVDNSAEALKVQRDSRMAMIGMARSAQPTNIAEHKDEYIADAILHRGETQS